jgi:hypothetical protein
LLLEAGARLGLISDDVVLLLRAYISANAGAVLSQYLDQVEMRAGTVSQGRFGYRFSWCITNQEFRPAGYVTFNLFRLREDT